MAWGRLQQRSQHKHCRRDNTVFVTVHRVSRTSGGAGVVLIQQQLWLFSFLDNPIPAHEEIKVSPRKGVKNKMYFVKLNVNLKPSISASCLLFCPWGASCWSETGQPTRSRWVKKPGTKKQRPIEVLTTTAHTDTQTHTGRQIKVAV